MSLRFEDGEHCVIVVLTELVIGPYSGLIWNQNVLFGLDPSAVWNSSQSAALARGAKTCEHAALGKHRPESIDWQKQKGEDREYKYVGNSLRNKKISLILNILPSSYPSLT
jgi:hypothetical protein